MTEHTRYADVAATPVRGPSPLWPDRSAFVASAEFGCLVPRESPSSWKFRTSRQARGAAPVIEPAASHLAGETRTRFRLHRPATIPVQAVAHIPHGRMTNPRLFRGNQTIRPPARHISAVEIYTEHFGLSSRPFTVVPDPDFLFWSTAHQHAFAMMEYGVLTRAPITLVTGEIGTGKTTLIQQLLRTVGPDLRIGLVSNSGDDPKELLRWVLMALGQPILRDATHQGLVGAFRTFLLAERAAGRRVTLVFDEAQNLCRDALEELRMLTNMNAGKNDLLQLVLVGQPELRKLVLGRGQHQFAQRIVSSYHLDAMDGPTTAAYIEHRLRVAGASAPIFTPQAVELIFEATGGVPRRINQLCDLALVYAFTADQPTVLRFAVQQVLDDGAFFGAEPVRRVEPALL